MPAQIPHSRAPPPPPQHLSARNGSTPASIHLMKSTRWDIRLMRARLLPGRRRRWCVRFRPRSFLVTRKQLRQESLLVVGECMRYTVSRTVFLLRMEVSLSTEIRGLFIRHAPPNPAYIHSRFVTAAVTISPPLHSPCFRVTLIQCLDCIRTMREYTISRIV